MLFSHVITKDDKLWVIGLPFDCKGSHLTTWDDTIWGTVLPSDSQGLHIMGHFSPIWSSRMTHFGPLLPHECKGLHIMDTFVWQKINFQIIPWAVSWLGYWPHDRTSHASFLQGQETFLFSKASRLAFGPTQLGTLSPWTKQPDCDNDHSSPH